MTDGFLFPEVAKADIRLSSRFVAPPFTVLDAKQGYWKTRKMEWNDLGIDAEKGREHLDATVVQTDWMQRGAATGGSLFDPVLCEVAYKWWCPKGGHVLDPFAGESTKGIVATCLGYGYTGVELRQEQVDANNTQAKAIGVTPNWITGDSARLEELLPGGEMYDLVFTSPPYYDLEIYSKDDKDGSVFATYAKFLNWYQDIFEQAVARLKPNRFLVVKVGDVRDERGAYRNFVGYNINIFMALGLHYYNEAVLVTPIGSLPLRVGRQFNAGRKLGKAHQNILVFYKGDMKKIKEIFGEAESVALV